MNLEGKTVLVTGASKGIGQGLAIRLAQDGADVSINYRSDPDGAAATLAEVEKAGRKGCTIQADMGKMESIPMLIEETVSKLGKIDVLVNNAGLERHADFWDVTEKDYDMVLNVNLKGPFFLTQAFVNYLRKRYPSVEKGQVVGKVINISSVHEDLPFPHFTSYCASKGGMKMMTRNLSIELAPLGVTINNVAPGAIETPINAKLLNDPEKLGALLANIPLKRLGQPNDISSAVSFLASEDSNYITGTTLVIDGGLTWNYEEQ